MSRHIILTNHQSKQGPGQVRMGSESSNNDASVTTQPRHGHLYWPDNIKGSGQLNTDDATTLFYGSPHTTDTTLCTNDHYKHKRSVQQKWPLPRSLYGWPFSFMGPIILLTPPSSVHRLTIITSSGRDQQKPTKMTLVSDTAT